LRLDQLPRSQGQQLAYAKLAHGNGHAQLHRQSGNRSAENRLFFALRRQRRRNQCLDSLPGGCAPRRRCSRRGCSRWMWCPRRCRQWMRCRHSARGSSRKRTRGRWTGLVWLNNCAGALTDSRSGSVWSCFERARVHSCRNGRKMNAAFSP
jgi:hypothetical protein